MVTTTSRGKILSLSKNFLAKWFSVRSNFVERVTLARRPVSKKALNRVQQLNSSTAQQLNNSTTQLALFGSRDNCVSFGDVQFLPAVDSVCLDSGDITQSWWLLYQNSWRPYASAVNQYSVSLLLLKAVAVNILRVSSETEGIRGFVYE